MCYDSRIRAVAKKRWSEAKLSEINFKGLEIPEGQVHPKDSVLLKDTDIPVCFKNLVAQELYEAEEEEIKQRVRSECDTDLFSMTVYNTKSDEQRINLVKGYQR